MIIEVIGAFIAIMAFAVMLETPRKYLKYAGMVGAVGWLAYLVALELGTTEVLATFVSSVTVTIVSHIFARILKVPVTVFLVAGILPTVPGAGMYRVVYSIITGANDMTSRYLVLTLEMAAAIALGIFIVDAIFRVFQKDFKQNSMRYQKRE